MMASHTYYEIDETYRDKGYGKEILRLGLQEAKRLGLSEIFLTCLENNVASRTIIESNGGIFMEDAIVPASGKRMLKYKIPLADIAA